MWGILVTLARLGVMQGVMALTSLVRNKVVALELGAQGLGDFSQIFLLASTLSVIITFGLDLGLNRNVAAAPDHAGRQLLLTQSNTTILALGLPLLVGIFAMLAMQPETMLLLGVANTPVILAALAILVQKAHSPLHGYGVECRDAHHLRIKNLSNFVADQVKDGLHVELGR